MRAADWLGDVSRLLEERVRFGAPGDCERTLLPYMPQEGADGRVEFDGVSTRAINLLATCDTLSPNALLALQRLATLPADRCLPVLHLAPTLVLDDYSKARVSGQWPAYLPRAAALALMRHAREVAEKASGRSFLLTFAREDAAGKGVLSGQPEGLLAAEILLPELAAQSPDEAQALVRSWMLASWELLWGGIAASTAQVDRLAMTAYAIARWAPAVGLREEARTLFARWSELADKSAFLRTTADGPREFRGVWAVSEALLLAQ